MRRVYHHDLSGRVLRKREISYEESTPETQDAYYHYDGRSSVSVLTDAQGVLVQKYHYLPYGGLMEGSDAKNRYGFSGKDLVPGTDLLDFGPRFMGPGVGRFLGPDRIDFPVFTVIQLNKYLYVQDNSMSDIDLSGMASEGEKATFWSRLKSMFGLGDETVEKSPDEVKTEGDSTNSVATGSESTSKPLVGSDEWEKRKLNLLAFEKVVKAAAKVVSAISKRGTTEGLMVIKTGGGTAIGTADTIANGVGGAVGGVQAAQGMINQMHQQTEQMREAGMTESEEKEFNRFDRIQHIINAVAPTPVP